MKDVPDPREVAAAKAAAELERLTDRVKTMRAVLIQLLQDVVRADSRLDSDQATQLVEANERLVVSALGAQSDVEMATGALDEASRVGGLDPLTALPNRTVLLDRLESAISNAKRHGNRVALLFLDLNDFKKINDTFGHATGDRALQLVADCLASVVRETDTVSRHGGDEFLVLLAEMASSADAAYVAEKINAALAKFGQVDGHPVRLSASIGISIYPEDGTEAKTLIKSADEAMYVAKKDLLGFEFQSDRLPDQPKLPAPAVQSQRRGLTHRELTVADQEHQYTMLREANEQLVLAALGAQELLFAAEEARNRQTELLATVANELGNPFAPIRLAASQLGLSGAEAGLALDFRAVVERQMNELLRLVTALLDPKQVNGDQMVLGAARPVLPDTLEE
jgi:diguanylate cyclase (GGDEF)-like protein